MIGKHRNKNRNYVSNTCAAFYFNCSCLKLTASYLYDSIFIVADYQNGKKDVGSVPMKNGKRKSVADAIFHRLTVISPSSLRHSDDSSSSGL